MPRNQASPKTQQPLPEQAVVATIDRPEPAPVPVATPHPAAVDAVTRRGAELAAAECLLQAVVDGRDITADENELLGYLYPTEFDRSTELRRIARSRRLQETAGSSADRAKAEKAASAAAVRLAVEGEVIRQKLIVLQGGLVELEKAATDATKESEARTAAAAALADATLLPEPHRSRYEFSRKQWESTYGIPVRTKRQEASGCLAKSGWAVHTNAEEIAAYAQSHKDCAGIVSLRFSQAQGGDEARDRRFVSVNAAAWEAHAKELRERAIELDVEADQLERDGAGLKKQIDTMLEQLIPV